MKKFLMQMIILQAKNKQPVNQLDGINHLHHSSILKETIPTDSKEQPA